MKRTYYPLRPLKGNYRIRKQAYLSCDSDRDNNLIACSAIFDNTIFEFDNANEVVNFILSLPNNTDIITYHIEYCNSIITAAIGKFDAIRGTGRDTDYLEFEYNDSTWYMIDLFSFFIAPLWEVSKRLGLRLIQENTSSKAACIGAIWVYLSDICTSIFGVYPARTVGNTALKTWKTTIDIETRSRGIKSQRFTRQACLAPALHWSPGSYHHATLYDMNAAYLHAMRSIKFPMHVSLFHDTKPPTKRWIALVKYNYTTTRKYSPAQVKLLDDDIIGHPVSVSNSRALLTYIDLYTLQMSGEVEILEWIEGIYWYIEDEIDLFTPWVSKIEAISQSSDINRMLIKIVSRALHSKFAQSEISNLLEIRRIDIDEVEKLSGKILEFYPLDDGGLAVKIHTVKRSRFKPYSRPDWEALILSACRMIMYSNIDDNTVYVNTDCIISTTDRNDIYIGDKFGEWKIEESGLCNIGGPNLYSIGKRNKASGVRVDNKRTLSSAIQSVTNGETVQINTARKPNVMSNNDNKDSTYKLDMIKYPHITQIGNIAYVTRSPTMETSIVPIRRKLSGNTRFT